MPGLNGTGPMGNGPMSGRGLGPCGQGEAIRTNAGMGRGARGGFRNFLRGRGFRQQFDFEPEQTLEGLKQQKQLIEEQIGQLEETNSDK
ncbi:MAG: DUF5320 domain-containing protein [Spirochaetes bacterium]|jgi:hypothetical protein|nr:DUF5320 domain-containing protein [Spirochaetota bacterium]